MKNIRFYAERTNFGRDIRIHATAASGTQEVAFVARPIVFEAVGDGDVPFESPPALDMRFNAAQQLMDALWDCGLRPTQGQQSHGQFAAQGRHLEDMRAMVSHLTKVELPK